MKIECGQKSIKESAHSSRPCSCLPPAPKCPSTKTTTKFSLAVLPFAVFLFCSDPGAFLGTTKETKTTFYREVLHGVGADGVGMKFPIFAVSCSRLPLSFTRIREKRRKTKKSEEKQRKAKTKTKKRRKKRKIPPTPSASSQYKEPPNFLAPSRPTF